MQKAIKTDQPHIQSPFNWQGRSSIFCKSQDFNGANHKRSRVQSLTKPEVPKYSRDNLNS